MSDGEAQREPVADAARVTIPFASESGSERGGDDTRLLHLEVTRIRPYDRNPRHTDNPEYERIKASMRAEGMAQPLVVTQRPGESDYMIAAGGNTRLEILRELHGETGEERFGVVPCIYRPWTGEADVLLGHLKENDLRGDLSFLDKARAVVEVKRLIAGETEAGEVTQTQLAAVLKARGYGLTQGRISQLVYTVETLLPLLPQALGTGLGRPQVERIRRLDRVARKLWSDRVRDEDDDYDSVFAALCRRYDAPEWDIENLRRALEAEIAERAGISIHAASMELDARLWGKALEEAPGVTADEHDAGIAEEAGSAALADANTVGRSADSGPISTAAPVEGWAAETAGPPSADRNEPERHNEEKGPEELDSRSKQSSMPKSGEAPMARVERLVPESPTESSAEAGRSGRRDLKSLRARSWTLARRLAQRHGIGELIAPLGDNGLGFLLRDVPDPALNEALDEDSLAQVAAVWWVLAACSEMTVAFLDHLLPAMEDGSVLKQALREQDAQLLFSRVLTLDPGHMGHRLWRRLDDRGWDELVSLMEAYRQIHRTAEETGVSPWGSPR